jgi:hypothetical protein
MLKSKFCLILTISSLVAVPFVFAQQLQRQLETEKGETWDTLLPHPLSWWTQDPLRLDTSGDLMLGFSAPDGKPLTAKDYREEQNVTTVGTLSGHRIIQILMSIRPGPRVVASGFAAADTSVAEWKDLLVGTGQGDAYVEIYALHYDIGGLVKETSAAIYGTGSDAILGTYDPGMGNGGGCSDGYWWFDGAGAHAIDFSPLIQAVSRALPPNATFTSRCWALHPQNSQLESWVQRRDAECHGCGGLGEVRATYRIEQGVAKPLSVSFEAAPSQ